MGRTAVYLESLPLPMLVELAQKADARGFDSIWKPEIIFSDAFVPCTAFALKTERIRIGSGVVGIYGRSPVVLAMSAAALAEISGNRLILGLGAQARSYVEKWHGLPYKKPVQRVRELVFVLRKLLSGEAVSYQGETLSLEQFQLGLMGPPPRVPIYVAAIGPRMAEAAGEVADGVIGYFFSEKYLRESFLPSLERGAKKAGRKREDIDVLVGFPTVVSDDPESRQWIKPQVVMFATAYGSSPSYQEIVRQSGFEKNLGGILEAIARGSMEEAVRHVSDQMVDTFTLCGTPKEVAARMESYRSAGVDVPMMNPIPPLAYYPLFAEHFPSGMKFPEPDVEAFVQNVEQAVSHVPL